MIEASDLTTDSLHGSNSTTTDTASISPKPNTLILFFVRNHNAAGGAPATPTLSGCGLTWVQVATRQLTADTSHRVTLFRAMGPAPTSGAVTISFAGTSTDERSWTVSQFTNTDTSGTNGSGAVVQSATNDAAGTPLSITLAAFATTANTTYGAMSTNTTSTITAGSGFTQIGTDTTPGGVQSQWQNANDTTVDWTFTGSSFGGGIAAEIKPAPEGLLLSDI